MRDWNEYAQVERPALDVLESMGWEVYDPEVDDDIPDERETIREVLLQDQLKNAIEQINDGLTENTVNRAVRKIRNITEPDPMRANKKIHNLLVQHTSIQQSTGHGQEHETVRYIDYDHPENNRFVAISQFTVQGGGPDAVEPDITLFVNGIPVGVVECKGSTIANPLDKGLEQMHRYQNLRESAEEEGAERLFWYNQHSVVSWKEGAFAGTYGTPKKHYKPWRSVHPYDDDELAEVLGKQQISPQDRTLYALFEPQRLLDFIQYYVVFQEDGNALNKMVARYQQHRAVEKALDRIHRRDETGEDGGVIWHTQGSGKSLTMMFLALKLRDEKPNPTILVVTDRTELDRQIKGTFEQCGYPNPKRMQSIDQLKEHLQQDAGETLTTLIQKFQETDEEDGFPVLTESEDVYVLTDEAHRTQYKHLATNMRIGLPNAFYLGFTGTPIEKDDRHTRRTFGDYVDTYTIDESIEDGTTERIKYQGRLADIHLEGQTIDDIFERVFSEYTEEERDKIRQRYARERDLAEAPERIKMICLDILDHFEHKISEPFKGMIVTQSRLAAARYKQQLDQLHGPESAVVISGDHNDPEELRDVTPEDDELRSIKDRFKDPSDSLTFVIVCDMLLTGYDVPVCQVMYLDKPLNEHNLLQAIARVNRPFPEKNYGLVVDYWGVADNLREALHCFTQEEVQNAMTPIEEERPRLEAAHRRAMAFFDDVDIDDLEACLQTLEDEEKRIQFNQAYRTFSRIMDIVLPDPLADPYRDDLKLLGKIYQGAKNRFRDKSMNLAGCGDKVRELIDQYIRGSGIEILNEDPVSIMDREEFEDHLDTEFDTDEARASEMKHALKEEISVNYEEDPIYYESLRERLEELIEEHEQRRLGERELLDELRDLAEDVRTRSQQLENLGLDNEMEFAIYNLLSEDLTEALEQNEEETEGVVAEQRGKYGSFSLTDFARDISEQITEEIRSIPDWKDRPGVLKDLRKEIKLYLYERVDDLNRDYADPLANQILEIARVHK